MPGTIDAPSAAVIYWHVKGVSMNNIRRFVAITLLGVGIAQAQINMPNPTAPGASMDSAVRIVSSSDIMVERFIARWLRTHYPGWDADPHEYTEFAEERYAVVYITHRDHPGRRVYFRVLQSHADPDNQGNGFPF
jgi:hypothetical protein